VSGEKSEAIFLLAKRVSRRAISSRVGSAPLSRMRVAVMVAKKAA
jgi:hypothetical protein